MQDMVELILELVGNGLREKDLTEEEYGTLAKEVMNICSRYQVSCILHNFWKTALELGCTSVHLPLPICKKQLIKKRKNLQRLEFLYIL